MELNRIELKYKFVYFIPQSNNNNKNFYFCLSFSFQLFDTFMKIFFGIICKNFVSFFNWFTKFILMILRIYIINIYVHINSPNFGIEIGCECLCRKMSGINFNIIPNSHKQWDLGHSCRINISRSEASIDVKHQRVQPKNAVICRLYGIISNTPS